MLETINSNQQFIDKSSSTLQRDENFNFGMSENYLNNEIKRDQFETEQLKI